MYSGIFTIQQTGSSQFYLNYSPYWLLVWRSEICKNLKVLSSLGINYSFSGLSFIMSATRASISTFSYTGSHILRAGQSISLFM